MIETIEELKEKRPDLVELFESMTHEQLLEQIYKECLDAIKMEDRVQLFMNECTGLSKTTYTLEAIKGLIHDQDLRNISDFCEFALDDIEGMDIQEIREYLKNEIIE